MKVFVFVCVYVGIIILTFHVFLVATHDNLLLLPVTNPCSRPCEDAPYALCVNTGTAYELISCCAFEQIKRTTGRIYTIVRAGFCVRGCAEDVIKINLANEQIY